MTEGLYGSASEGQVPALLEAFQVLFTFSDASTMALCLDKGWTKMVLEHYQVPTAPFAVIRFNQDKDLTWEEIQDMINDSRNSPALSNYPLFAKPLAEGSSKGIVASNRIRHPDDMCRVVNSLRASSPSCPGVLLETFLPGREFTVGILGTGDDAWVLGVTEMVWKSTGNSESSIQFTTAESKATDGWDGLADEVNVNRTDPDGELACQVARKAWTVLGCRDGGRIDIRLDSSSGKPVANVMEINPLAGLRPAWSQLPIIAENNGVSFDDMINHILQSAMKSEIKQNQRKMYRIHRAKK